MNKRQKAILTNFIIVIAVTIIAVVGMVNLKDWINRAEAMRAMSGLGQIVLNYRKEHGPVPPESYVEGIRGNLPGGVRLANLKYRARWLSFDSAPDEILGYAEKNYPSSFLPNGYVVLRLDGRVEWLKKAEFEALLARQQSPLEIQMQQQ